MVGEVRDVLEDDLGDEWRARDQKVGQNEIGVQLKASCNVSTISGPSMDHALASSKQTDHCPAQSPPCHPSSLSKDSKP